MTYANRTFAMSDHVESYDLTLMQGAAGNTPFPDGSHESGSQTP